MEHSTKQIIFSGTFLSLNDVAVSFDNFKTIITESVYRTIQGKKATTLEFEFENNSFLKIKLGDGSAMPRNPNVIDVETNTSIPNPRQPSQAEPKETFGLFDFKTGILWISNSKKKNLILDFIRSKLDGKSLLVSKDVYDELKFIETIKKLEYIKLSAVPNIFSQTNTLSASLVDDINGYEATTAQITFSYQDKFIGNNLLEKIKSIFQNRANFNGVVISGRDEKNLGMLFNSDGFSRKIEFKSEVDENEMFLPTEVFSKLIYQIINEGV